MKLKTEEEIEEAYMDKFYDSKDDFQDEESFVKGALWMQQDLLSQASEGFEEYCVDRIIRGTYKHDRVFNAFTGNYLNLNDCEQLWQASSLSHAKKMQEKMQEKDAEIEALTKEKDAWKTMYLELRNRVAGG